MIENTETKERVILVAVAGNTAANDIDNVKESLSELGELVKTAGAETVGQVIQNRETVHAGTYIGKGKIDEVAELLRETGADGILTDDELSPAQMKNLEDALGCKVMDRTMLILDIFAKHASTKEGTIQVELAQLKYRATRLIGAGTAMSRLGGGIGTRGPGEKKLEVDRRLIRNRISQLNSELKEVQQNRETQRARRERSAVPVVAIVGYTNAGKSTLLNRLTGAGVLSEDKLFATLDPTTRAYKTADGQEILFTDTVGFIRKLPHHLVDAFRSTLEEAKYADLVLHVVDASGEAPDVQMAVVYETLGNLGVTDKPVVTALNKQDIAQGRILKDLRADRVVKISAKTGEGVEELVDTICEVLREQKIYIEKVIPYAEAGKVAEIRRYGELLSEEYVADGISVKAYLPKDFPGTI
ncbi:MAG: GTPase HflX [Lachnospiraceae bacterium]|nr:GTPase HflX [Lachnospiraceae bacterium]